jgi:hypothetical protein
MLRHPEIKKMHDVMDSVLASSAVDRGFESIFGGFILALLVDLTKYKHCHRIFHRLGDTVT